MGCKPLMQHVGKLRPQRIRRAALAAVLTASIGLFGAGVATGFWVNNNRIANTQSDPGAESAARPGGTVAGSSSAVPDVRGLTESVAVQVLADSVGAGRRVEIRTRPYAGLVGVVVEQEPAFGTAAPPVVTLTVSSPAAVPVATGTSESDLRAQLLELGAQVAVVRRYVPAIAPGTVLDILPPAGSELPEKVTVTIAEAPSTAYLSEVKASKNGCSTGSYTQAGTKRDNALSCSVSKLSSADPSGPMWEFAGAVEDVDLAFGLPTDAKPGGSVHVELFADGRRIAESDVAFGATAKLSVSTSGALQFMIVATAVAGEPDRVTVTGTVRGSRDAIVALTEKK